jgi:hypothetical protein
MAGGIFKKLSKADIDELLKSVSARFGKNMKRHQGIQWEHVQAKLQAHTEKLWSLYEMERTGGEPDVVGWDKDAGTYLFYDCSPESPAGRRSVCYDTEGLESRKEHKPAHSALGMAAEMGIRLMSEQEYKELQEAGPFDTKTSSWIQTPAGIRELGGALFADYRYGSVFVYHNGASSYYASRGFRGVLRL